MNVDTHFVHWIPRNRRSHGSAYADIEAIHNVKMTHTYEEYASPVIEWPDGKDMHKGSFSFWSVVGGADGPLVQTEKHLSVPIGNSDIVATAWYIYPHPSPTLFERHGLFPHRLRRCGWLGDSPERSPKGDLAPDPDPTFPARG
jgi:hypothetical protein